MTDRVGRAEAVRSWVSYEIIPSGVRLRCSLVGGGEAEARLTFPLPSVMRLQIAPGLLTERPALLPALAPVQPPAVTVQADDSSLTLASPPLSVRIQGPEEPWRLQVFAARGESVFAEPAGEPALTWEQDGAGRLSAGFSFSLGPDEALFGLGAQAASLNHRGRAICCRVATGRGIGGDETSAPIPFLWSPRGYGLYVHTVADVLFDLGNRCPAACRVSVDDGQMDYFLLYGPTPGEILHRYAQVTGFAPALPPAAFGLWMTRPAGLGAGEIEETCVSLRARHIPCDGVHITAPEAASGPGTALSEVERLADDLGQIGFQLGLTVRPAVPLHARAYREAVKKGYLVRERSGRPLLRPGPEGPEALVDLTLPAARVWWQACLREALPAGAGAFLAGEGSVPEKGFFHDGTPGAWMRNRYPLLCLEAVQEVLAEAADRTLLGAETAWAGSQRRAVYWGAEARPGPAYLAAQLRAVLSLAASGHPFASPALAVRPPLQDPALHVRACQLAFLAPLARWDGSLAGIGREAEAIIRDFARLRNQLAPYLYAAASGAAAGGLPLARPLAVDYPADRNTWHLDHQYLLGPHLLIAAAWEAQGDLPIYLPGATWVDFWSDEILQGSGWRPYPVFPDRLPILVKAGAIIPMQAPGHVVGLQAGESLTLHAYPQASGGATLYDEQGEAYPISLQSTGDEMEIRAPFLGLDCRVILHATPAPAAVTVDGQPALYEWEEGRATIELGRGRRLHYLAQGPLAQGYRAQG